MFYSDYMSYTAWEETGSIPDCEDLKIHTPAGTSQSPTNLRSTRVLRKKRVKTTHNVRPVDLLEEDSDTTPGQGAHAEVSNSDKPTSPSTGNNQADSSTENPGLTQKPHHQSPSAVKNKTAQTQGPPPSSHPQTNTAVNKTVPVSHNSQVPDATSNPSNTSSAPTGHTSGNPPPEPTNTAAPSEPLNPNTLAETDQPNTSETANNSHPAPGPQQAPQQSHASQSSTPTNTNLTIIQNVDARIEVITMQQNENRGRANWQQYRTYWESLSCHIKFRAESMQNVSPIQPDSHFQRASCSYASWIKTISSLGN